MISVQQTEKLSPAMAASQSFCAHLADGLHAAAQPLTVLLASLSKEYTESMQADELRELAASSLAEVQRVCDLFHQLQELVGVESTEPEMASSSILSILQQVAEETRQLFTQAEVQLTWTTPAACPLVLLDRARTMYALSNVLLAARAVSSKNDTIAVAVTCESSSALNIRVHHDSRQRVHHDNSRRKGADMAAIHTELTLMMAVAEANMRGQHSGFSCCLQPFRVDIRLPLLPIAEGRQ